MCGTQNFISRFYIQEYYNTALEALEELNVLLPALEPYATDDGVSETIKKATTKIAQAEALIPEAKARFESSVLIEQIRSYFWKINVPTPNPSSAVTLSHFHRSVQQFIKTWHHKPYYDEAIESIETINTLLPILETYSADRYAAETVQKAREILADADSVIPQAKMRFEGGPLCDQVISVHGKLDVRHHYYLHRSVLEI